MFIEIIATNYHDCQIIAQAGNISRIELCADLNRGGLTHHMMLLKKALPELKYQFVLLSVIVIQIFIVLMMNINKLKGYCLY